MEEHYLNDPLNLKDLIQTITDFLHDKDPESSLGTMLDFLNRLFQDNVISDFAEESKRVPHENGPLNGVVIDMQKLLSGTPLPKSYRKFFELLEGGQLDEAIRTNLQVVLNALDRVDGSAAFWRSLRGSITFPFFSRTEVARLRELIDQKAYEDCLLDLLKHSFKNWKSIPAFAAQHAYEEAQTYDFDSPPRYKLLKLAADLGHERAAQEYGNYAHRMYHDRQQADYQSDAFRYTLKALPLPSALWNLAYQLMGQDLSREQVDELRRTINLEKKLGLVKARETKRKESERKESEFEAVLPELEYVHCMADTAAKQRSYDLAYRINFYLAYSGFAKGFNSLYVLLCMDKYGFELTDKAPFADKAALADYYLEQAAANGCLFALQNAGLAGCKHLLQQQGAGADVDPQELTYTRQMLQTAASYGMERSAVSLGELYLDGPDPNPGEAQRWLDLAVSYNDHNVRALCGLGRLANSSEKKRQLFQRAMRAGSGEQAGTADRQMAAHAALLYAQECGRQYALSSNDEYRKDAEKFVRAFHSQMSPADQKLAETYLRSGEV